MAAPIRVKLITNTKRQQVVVSSDVTPKKVLQENNIEFAMATMHLDGTPLTASEMNKTFEQLGITDECMLACAMKTNNA